MSDVEKASIDRDEHAAVEVKIQFDRHHLPLIPQPSSDPNDPLNWSTGKKMAIVAMMATLAFFATFSVAVINPAFAQVGREFGISSVAASYLGALPLGGAGVGCFLWSPLANVYGRRPVLIFAHTIAVVAGLGPAFTGTYHTLLGTRFVQGFGNSATNVLSAVIIGDIFCIHERGKMIGIVTVALTNGPHVAFFPGGYVAVNISWRWTLILPGITATACWLMIFVGLPETLYLRGPGRAPPTGRDTFLGERRLWGFRPPERHFRPRNSVRPILLLKYPPILAVALFTGVAFTLGTIMPAKIASALFFKYYRWDSAHTGVAVGIATTIGGFLGEVIAGPVTDRLMRKARQRAEGKAKPESRLHAMWPGVILLPIGLVIFGCMIQFYTLKNSWAGACVAIGLTSFAMQVVLTPGIAYIIDCYKGQAAQALQTLNFVRLMMSVSVSFWSIPFGDKVGFQYSGLALALVTVVFFIPITVLMRHGEKIRAWTGTPQFDEE